MEIIQVADVTFNYDTEQEEANLKNVSLNIKKGEFVAIIGHNGSGKSTLAKHINALLLPEKGDVYVFGMNTKEPADTFKIRQKAGMVFQNPDNQMVTSIVEEDVAFGPENLGVESSEIRKRVDAALQSVNMQEFAHHAPDQLSGGQKQRIAIAGVLAMESDIIVFDEPTAMLDPSGRKEVMDTIIRLNRDKNITVLLITHFMEEAALADRIVVVSGGEIAMQGTPEEVFAAAKQIEALGLEVPFNIQVAQALRELGVDVSNEIDEDKMVDELCRLISKT